MVFKSADLFKIPKIKKLVRINVKIFVKAKPSAKETRVERIDDTHFDVSVKEPPINGLANRAIIKALADHFHVSNSEIGLVSGFASKQKMFEVKI